MNTRLVASGTLWDEHQAAQALANSDVPQPTHRIGETDPVWGTKGTFHACSATGQIIPAPAGSATIAGMEEEREIGAEIRAKPVESVRKATPVQLMFLAPLTTLTLGAIGLILIAYALNRDASELSRRERLIIATGSAVGLFGSIVLKPFEATGLMPSL